MNIWTILTIAIGLMVVAGVAVSAFIDDGSTIDNNNPSYCQTPTASCGNTCTASNNCGRTTCEAISGGSCGCQD